MIWKAVLFSTLLAGASAPDYGPAYDINAEANAYLPLCQRAMEAEMQGLPRPPMPLAGEGQSRRQIEVCTFFFMGASYYQYLRNRQIAASGADARKI